MLMSGGSPVLAALVERGRRELSPYKTPVLRFFVDRYPSKPSPS